MKRRKKIFMCHELSRNKADQLNFWCACIKYHFKLMFCTMCWTCYKLTSGWTIQIWTKIWIGLICELNKLLATQLSSLQWENNTFWTISPQFCYLKFATTKIQWSNLWQEMNSICEQFWSFWSITVGIVLFGLGECIPEVVMKKTIFQRWKSKIWQFGNP